jgi:hypothetical protein
MEPLLPTDEIRKKPVFDRLNEPLGLGPDCEVHVFKTEDAARLDCGR